MKNKIHLYKDMDPKSIPQYNPNKHFWEQSSDVLQFWNNEWDKILNGVTVGGYHISGWWYFHTNFFITPIPQPLATGGTEDVLMSPTMDDNMMLITETYYEAKRLNKGVCIFGSRGVAKSVALASLIYYTMLTTNNGTFPITSGDQADLGEILNLLYIATENVHPAFSLPILKRDDAKEIIFGMRFTDNTTLRHGRLKILNADAGKANKSEKGAGGSPVGFIGDEIGKYKFLKVYESALPSFETPYGFRCTPVLAGTSGNDELSKDARKILANPESFNFLPINYDRLERYVREEDITWKRTKSKKFATFMPGQMSYRLESQKTPKPLSEVLGIKDEHLSKILIKTTNWEEASKLIQEKIDNASDKEAANKIRMYYPRNLDDVFLTGGTNPFPKEVIKDRIEYLQSLGKVGRPVELTARESFYREDFSDKDLAPTYYDSGIVDSPIIMYTSMPTDRPPLFRNVAGLDHYKLDGEASKGSLGAFYVLQRRNVDINTPCEVILASYAARPNTHRVFNQNGERLIRTFNAKCNMESVDISFQQFLQNKQQGLENDLLAPAFSFAQGKGKNSSLTTRFGLYPTAGNNKVRMDYLFEWSKEEHIVGQSEDGNPIVKLSVEFIDDIDLLQEMLDYTPEGNFDRISAFSHALIYARELDKFNVIPKQDRPKQEEYHKKYERRSSLSGRRSSAFR